MKSGWEHFWEASIQPGLGIVQYVFKRWDLSQINFLWRGTLIFPWLSPSSLSRGVIGLLILCSYKKNWYSWRLVSGLHWSFSVCYHRCCKGNAPTLMSEDHWGSAFDFIVKKYLRWYWGFHEVPRFNRCTSGIMLQPNDCFFNPSSVG